MAGVDQRATDAFDAAIEVLGGRQDAADPSRTAEAAAGPLRWTAEARARLWAKIDTDGAVSSHRPDLGRCWLWTAQVEKDGYGRFRGPGSKKMRAHRAVYEAVIGRIRDGLTLDHLCRVRLCVRPSHMEPVTMGENVLRGTSPTAINARRAECVHGHPFDEQNTYWFPNGRRSCRACNRAAKRRYRQARS